VSAVPSALAWRPQQVLYPCISFGRPRFGKERKHGRTLGFVLQRSSSEGLPADEILQCYPSLGGCGGVYAIFDCRHAVCTQSAVSEDRDEGTERFGLGENRTEDGGRRVKQRESLNVMNHSVCEKCQR